MGFNSGFKGLNIPEFQLLPLLPDYDRLDINLLKPTGYVMHQQV